MSEFFGKMAQEVSRAGDEYIVVFNDKISEWLRKKHFPQNSRTFSQPDWCFENYQKGKEDFNDFTWKEFIGDFDRFNQYKAYNFNYENSREIVSQVFHFAKYIFETEKPDLILAEPETCTFNEAFSFWAKKHNSSYLGFIDSKIPDRIDIYNSGYTCPKYQLDFNKTDIKDIPEEEKTAARAFIRDFVEHKKKPSYMDYHKNWEAMGEIGKIRNYIRRERELFPFYLKYRKQRKRFKKFDFNSEILIKYPPLYLKKALKSRVRKVLQANIFDSKKQDSDFYLFPLHLQPEASTTVRAAYFSDQLNAIKNIAFSLPFPEKLYVKEHPLAFGTHNSEFYKKIKELPNVFLLSHKEKTEELVKKCKGVITLTSTIGLEAVFSGKPAYILGNVFYEYHPLAFRVSGFEELRSKLKENPAISDLDNTNIRFFVSYFKNTTAGDIILAVSKNDTNNYKEIYEFSKRTGCQQ